MRSFFFFGLALAAALPLSGADPRRLEFSSGVAQTTLLELYTSEGCSSCPPAEKFVATLRDQPGLWRDFVPVAFHVDFWNRLGWPDRFSTREFTQREYAYSAAWNSTTVYTPCFVRNGADAGNQHLLAQSGTNVGRLAARYEGETLHVEFTPSPALAGGTFEVHVAILGGGITSKVGGGENQGETLHHEFVALALRQAPLGREIALPLPKVTGVSRHALAVWITRQGDLTPIQATGGWLD
jgi:hypothetical protein